MKLQGFVNKKLDLVNFQKFIPPALGDWKSVVGLVERQPVGRGFLKEFSEREIFLGLSRSLGLLRRNYF